MKIFILLITILSVVNASWDFTGKTNTFITNVEKRALDNSKSSEQIYAQTLQLNIDYNYKNFHFQATPFAYIYSTNSNEPVQYRNWSDPYPKSDMWFRSLYMTYTLDEWSIGAGVLPFSNSSPTKFNDDYIEDGEGILLINDSVLQSVFILHKRGNSRTIFGWGTSYHAIVNSGNYIDPTLRENAFSIFLINTYKHDKWEFVTEYLYNDVRYNKKKLAKDTLIGMTIAWNDSEESGLSVYGSFAGCKWENNAHHSRDEIFNTYFSENPYGISGAAYGNIVESMYPNNFAFEEETTWGAAYMIGFRHDFDIENQEFFVNAEWTHTYNDWISGNQGTFYLGKNNQYYNIRNDSLYAQIGWIVNENLRFRLSHEYIELNSIGKIGNPGVTIPNEESIKSDLVDRISTTTVTMSYKF